MEHKKQGRPPKNTAIDIQEATDGDNAIENQHDTFDVELAKARVANREASKGKNNAKSESFAVTTEKYAVFCKEIVRRKKTGWSEKSWQDTQALAEAIDEYKDFIFEVKLYPTIEGLALWLDISKETYYAILNLGDLGSDILKKYKNFLDDFSAQNIISTEGNPAGNMYLDKSRLGFSDQPSEVNINLNMNPTSNFAQSDFGNMVKNMPVIDADFKDVSSSGDK